MPPRRPLRRPFALVAAIALGGCGLLPIGGPAIHLDNRTSGPVTVNVKGAQVGTYPSGSSAEVPLGGHGEPPYMVTVHSPSGQVLIQLEVSAEDIKAAADGSGATSGSGDSVCGLVRLSMGKPFETLPPIAFAQLPACP